eukprot:Seg1183.10 transcript_id=Seg1183.10/GoldUCD/mRNA.D3Y31 product="26S proteasome non-ATPase regulatory subunit 8" protein_id=Seg1183.10/GoldUCD/D3Y31
MQLKMATSSTKKSLNTVISMYQNLIKEWNKKPPILDVVGKLLTNMKLALIGFQYMPTTGSMPSPQELILARDVLEIGVQWSVVMKDIPSFERYMAQLKCYYYDYSGILPESPYMYQLLGLNLMSLLAQNRLGEFHTELELLPAKEIQNSVYIRCPVALEQYLMEGSYHKVFLAKDNVPAEAYYFFINILIDTLRDEVAACMEKSYQQISFKEATRMLFFQNDANMTEYSVKRGWSIVGNSYHFTADAHDKQEVSANKLIEQCLGYAKELERIV